LADGDPFAFAGLWETWEKGDEPVESCALITAIANEVVAQAHDRMPVILERETRPMWVGEQDGDPTRLLRPADEGFLRIWPVSKAVGNVRNDTRTCSSRTGRPTTPMADSLLGRTPNEPATTKRCTGVGSVPMTGGDPFGRVKVTAPSHAEMERRRQDLCRPAPSMGRCVVPR